MTSVYLPENVMIKNCFVTVGPAKLKIIDRIFISEEFQFNTLENVKHLGITTGPDYCITFKMTSNFCSSFMLDNLANNGEWPLVEVDIPTQNTGLLQIRKEDEPSIIEVTDYSLKMISSVSVTGKNYLTEILKSDKKDISLSRFKRILEDE